MQLKHSESGYNFRILEYIFGISSCKLKLIRKMSKQIMTHV